MRRLRLLGREGCHLCDVMATTLDRVLPHYGLEYAKVDVDSEPELARIWGEWVPVLLDGDRELARVRVSTAELEARLSDSAGGPLRPVG